MLGRLDRLSNTSHLTTRETGTDRVSYLFKSDPPLDPKFFRTNFFPLHGKFECLRVSSSLRINRIWYFMWLTLSGCHSRSNRTHFWNQNRSEGQILSKTASSNVWMSHHRPQYFAWHYTRHWHVVVLVQIGLSAETPPGSKQTNFFHLQQRSSNVWLSRQAEQYIQSDMACTWRSKGVAAVPIEPTSGSKIVQQKTNFLHATRQVRMAGWAIHPVWPHTQLALLEFHTRFYLTLRWTVMQNRNKKYLIFSSTTYFECGHHAISRNLLVCWMQLQMQVALSSSRGWLS